MTTPADELRQAAHKLRQDAEAARIASPLPWAVTDEHVVRCADESIVVDRSSTTNPRDRGDLPFIAAMHPGVGAALADWLESWVGIDFNEHAAMAGDLAHALAWPGRSTPPPVPDRPPAAPKPGRPPPGEP